MEKAKNCISNLPSEDTKKILEMAVKLPSVSTEKLESIDKSKLPKNMGSLVKSLYYIAKFNDGGFSTDADKTLAFQELLKTSSNTLDLVSIAFYTGQIDAANEIIQKEKISQNDYLYQLRDHFQKQEVVDILNTSNTALIANGEVASISEKVKTALEYDPTNKDTLEIAVAVALLNKDSNKVKEYASKLSEEKQQEIIFNYSKDNKAENIEELIEQCDPKKIHAYHQRIKQQRALAFNKEVTIDSWYIDEQEVKKTDTIPIKKYKELNCFAKISESIKSKLDDNVIDSFTKAIEKGIIHSKTGVNGVKFLQDKAVEVKMKGDMRLYTNKMYENSYGELLIDFDHYGNHNEVANFANNHHLEILGN